MTGEMFLQYRDETPIFINYRSVHNKYVSRPRLYSKEELLPENDTLKLF